MLCINPRCRAPMGRHYWGEGYCCAECMSVCMEPGESMTESLHEPTTGRTICRNADEIDLLGDAYDLDPALPRIVYEFARFSRVRVPTVCRAMMEAHRIDARLPAVLFWRQQGESQRAVGRTHGITRQAVASMLDRLPPKLLRRLRMR